MGAFEHDGVSLSYEDTGGDRPAVVFLHGLSGSAGTWAPFVEKLSDRFRVVRLDQRGHGESSHAPGTYVLENYVADAVAFLVAVVRGPSVLVGHSLGGVVAHQVAQDRPDLVRAALLEDPPLYVAERIEESAGSGVAAMFPIMQQVSREMQGREAPLEEYVGMIGGFPALNGVGTLAEVLGPDGTRAFAEAFMRLDPDIFTPAIDGGAIRTPDLSKPVACPVVLLRADPAIGAAFDATDEPRFLAVNPDARVVQMTGASHAIHDEQPGPFLDELLALLDRVPASSG